MTDQSPQDGGPKKLPLPKIPAHEITIPGMGKGYVRPLTMGRLSNIAKLGYDKDDLKSLGYAVMAACVTATKEEQDPLLSTAQVSGLEPAEQASLAKAVAEVNGWTLEGDEPVVAVGAAFHSLMERFAAPIVESFKKIQEAFGPSLLKLKDVLSGPAMKGLVEHAALSKRMTDALETPNWLDSFKREIETRDLLNIKLPPDLAFAPAVSPRVRFPKPIELPTIDIENSPLGRAARATEETKRSLDDLLELSRSTLQELSRMGSVLSQTSTEYLAKATEDRTHALRNQRITVVSVVIAAAALLTTAALAGWQLNQAYRYKLESDAQQARIETYLKRQTEALEHQSQARAQQLPQGDTGKVTPPFLRNLAPAKQ